MAIHVAKLQLMHVDSVTGVVFTKDNSKLKDFTSVKTETVSPQRSYSTEFRVVVDATIASSAGNPDIPTYLALEATAGFKFAHMDQTYLITQS